ncbi:uncharacterized protein LOC129583379 [Paramacrobiotus metropolitanus]|uniref:uncharacterized protein LOC129583379 n=1 Tax=Paramacrobiotus metropolitanus TaxID=2943436 RepID=UPI00244621B9|nr:uncharacterized protein LOC129583379 [Paramacrobiotus metropolitanus]
MSSGNFTNATSQQLIRPATDAGPWSLEHFIQLLHACGHLLAHYATWERFFIFILCVLAIEFCRRLRKFSGLSDYHIMMAKEMEAISGIREEIEAGRIAGAKKIQYNFSITWTLPKAKQPTAQHYAHTGNRSVHFLDSSASLSESDVSLNLPPVPCTPVSRKKSTFSVGRIRDSIGLARHRMTGPKKNHLDT